MQQARIIIKGRVQGVFYRATAQEKAQELGLKGYVKNLEDGTVEALVQGDKAAIEIFIKWCHEGPPSSKVETINVEWQTSTERYSDFSIL